MVTLGFFLLDVSRNIKIEAPIFWFWNFTNDKFSKRKYFVALMMLIAY